jgi:hypothetical protein
MLLCLGVEPPLSSPFADSPARICVFPYRMVFVYLPPGRRVYARVLFLRVFRHKPMVTVVLVIAILTILPWIWLVLVVMQPLWPSLDINFGSQEHSVGFLIEIV